MNASNRSPSRRSFLGAAASGGLLLSQTLQPENLVAAETSTPGIRTVVIGTGGRGSDLIRNLTTIEECEVVGVCDDYQPHLAQGLKYAGPQAKPFANYKEMLEKLKPQAAVIAVPIGLHYEVASACVAAGCATFVEKTMCYSIDEAHKLAKQVRDAKAIFQVGIQRRANPVYQQAAAMVESGMIGQITAIKAQWHRHNNWRRPIPVAKADPNWQKLEHRLNWRLYKETSGGLMAELGSHQMDIANWLLGVPPKRVLASGGIDYWRDGRTVNDNIFCLYEYEVPNPPALKGTGPTGEQKSRTVRVTYSSLCNNAYEGAAELILGTKGTLYLTANKGLMYREAGSDRVQWADPLLGEKAKQGEKSPTKPIDAEAQAAETQAAVVAAGKTLGLSNDPWAHRGKPLEIDIERGNDTRDELVSFFTHIAERDPATICDVQAGLINTATVLIANQSIETGGWVNFPGDLS